MQPILCYSILVDKMVLEWITVLILMTFADISSLRTIGEFKNIFARALLSILLAVFVVLCVKMIKISILRIKKILARKTKIKGK